jgi:hypothetical protein
MITKFKVNVQYKGSRVQSENWIVTVCKTEGTRITIANAYQLFWRSLENPEKWLKIPERSYYKEYPADTRKLNTITVINIEEEEKTTERLFKIGKGTARG